MRTVLNWLRTNGLAAAVVVGAMASNAMAGIVTINISSPNISGENGGLLPGSMTTIANWPISGSASLTLTNASTAFSTWGLAGQDASSKKLEFAVDQLYAYATPRNFSSNAAINGSANWTSDLFNTAFRYSNAKSPVFNASSYMGFRFTSDNGSNWRYGWIQVTWNGQDKFQIYAAAYEDAGNTPILAGAGGPGGGGGAVPEPTSMAIFGLGALGFAYRNRRKLVN